MTGLILALVALVLFVSTAHGYELNGFRQPEPVVTHTESSELAPYVATALTEWGRTSAIQDGGAGPDITVTLGDAAGNGAFTQPWVTDGKWMDHCDITVNANMWAGWSEAMRLSTVAHEVGHCLGMAHSDDGIMVGVAIPDHPTWFTADDRAGIAALYPRAPMPHRLVLPMVN